MEEAKLITPERVIPGMTPAEMRDFGITPPPTQDELPYSDEAPMESNLHVLQMILLIETGVFGEEQSRWLRWESPDGILIPTPQEKAAREARIAEQERSRAEHAMVLAEQERLRAEQEQQRTNELGEMLARYRERFGELPE